MSQLKIHLLGSPQLERDGEPITVDTRKAIALMAYLAVTGEPQMRETLAALLWPDYESERARGALRRTLSVLNTALDKHWLTADRQMVDLSLDESVWLDVAEFQRRIGACRRAASAADPCPTCLPWLAEAVALYRDDFLAGFTLRDSANFDDWQFFQAESLRRDLAFALEQLVICHGNRREYEPAIAYARRWLVLDPLHEPAHRALMRLYAGSGQRAAMLRQYRECVRILDEELGVAPLEETNALYEQLRHEIDTASAAAAAPEPTQPAEATPAPPASTIGPSQPEAYPLVGRAAAWQQLMAGYQAGQPPGHFIVLEGEAGVGKTRLAQEFLAAIQARSATTLRATCYEGETNLAYNPFVECLRSIIQPDTNPLRRSIEPHILAEAARLLPELHARYPDLPSLPPLDNLGAQNHFFEGIGQVLLQLSRGLEPGLIFIDDLHWADEASLDLLTYLVRRLAHRPLVILVTWRSEHVPPGHRLRALLAEAQRRNLATLILLERLSRADVLALVQAVVAGETAQSEALGERLFQETEGLPFFLIEYLTALTHQAGSFEAGVWSMPAGVRDLLHSRLAVSGEAGWQLLTTAAVIGRSFEFETLRVASGRSEEETVTGLEQLLAAGLIIELSDDARRPVYDFYHEKLRALAYDETSLARRRLLHRRVAEAFSSRSRGQPDPRAVAGQIAQHYRLAGQDADSADYFQQAGDYARTLFANAEALAHYRTALALGHPDTAGLHEKIGDLQTLRGEYSAAIMSYERAAASVEDQVLARLEHRLGEVQQRLGAWDQAESHFQTAQTLLVETNEQQALAHLYADWSRMLHQQGQPDRAGHLAQQALTMAEAAADARALAQAHNILGILANSTANLEAAEDHLRRSLDLAEGLGDPAVRMAALNNLALTYRANDKPTQALDLTQTALSLCQSLGDRHRQAALHNNLADLYHDLGQSEAAMAHLKQAVAIFAEIGAEVATPQPEVWMLVAW